MGDQVNNGGYNAAAATTPNNSNNNTTTNNNNTNTNNSQPHNHQYTTSTTNSGGSRQFSHHHNHQGYQRKQYSNNGGGYGGGGGGMYNNGYRNYWKTRRHYNNNSSQQSDFHYNNNRQNNNGYNNRGGYYHHHHNRNQGSRNNYYNNNYSEGYRRNNNSNGSTPLPSPDYEEGYSWGGGVHYKQYHRGNWSHNNDNNCSYVNCYNHSSSSRNCSPDHSPTSDVSGGSFPSGEQGNGNEGLGTYEYFLNSIHGHHNGVTTNVFPYSAFASGNYFSGFPSGSANAIPDRESTSESSSSSSMAPGATEVQPLPSDSNCSSIAESCTNSPEAEKSTDWASDASDTGSNAGTPGSNTRCSSREAYPDNFFPPEYFAHAHYRCLNNYGMYSRDYSPGTFYLNPPKRSGAQRSNIPFPMFPREFPDDLELEPNDLIKQFNRVVDLKDKPFNFVGENSLTPLDNAIWSKFYANQQTLDTFRKKIELWRDVFTIVRRMNFESSFKYDVRDRNFLLYGLQVVGSTMSGFGSNTSDVDMCLVIRDAEVDQRFEAVERLQSLANYLRDTPFLDNIEIIYAKVPILKFRDINRRLDVDLNCNNFVGIRNTHLLYAYSQMDWRLKPLVLILKLWAQYHKINDAKMMTISSYSLVLMTIHFLQHGLDDPVLPNLQKEFPDRFHNAVPIMNVKIHDPMPTWRSKNTLGLGELLVLLLEYYARKFDYKRDVISVRAGGTIPVRQAANFKSAKNDFHHWRLLCVEEPFDRTNTARSVYDKSIFERILTIFHASWQRLLGAQNLDCIFTPFSEEELKPFQTAVAARLR